MNSVRLQVKNRCAPYHLGFKHRILRRLAISFLSFYSTLLQSNNNNNNNNNYNISVYGANSTIQFSNAPHKYELYVILMNNNNRKNKTK